MINPPSTPKSIACGNARVNKFTLATAIGMCLYGLLLPSNWAELLGPLSWPIVWAASSAPGAVNLTQISPIPTLVSGFLGLSSWVVVLFALTLAWKDPMGERVQFAFARPGASKFKMGVLLYVLFVPLCLFVLWVVFAVPVPIELSGGLTWREQMLAAMFTSRLDLALYGSVATCGLGLIAFFVIVLLAGPITLLVNGNRAKKEAARNSPVRAQKKRH